MPPPFSVLIPARMASSRLPGKPLADIHGRPMVVRVAERAQASGADRVVIATDDQQIASAAAAFGVAAVLTRADHPSGSDRLAEAVELLGLADDAIVVNVQGDEPLIAADLIRDVAAHLAAHPDAVMSTACHRIHDWDTFLSPHVVKVVADRAGYALYFSRSPIPHVRDGMDGAWPDGLPAWRHVGIYAYRAGFLRRYPALPAAAAEQLESLEQLRVLDHGYRISVLQAAGAPAPGVDTPADLARVRALVAANGNL